MNALKKITRVISNIIFYILLFIILLLVIYIVVINVYRKQDRLGDIPINFYTILTTSMVPKIDAGDIVVTYKNQDNMYEVNDVITFVSESNVSKGTTITHRIINKEMLNGKYYYYTKGDSNSTGDTSPVSSTNVIGKVVLKIPKAGYIQQFMLSKFGWLVVVVLPCLAIIAYDVVKIFEKIFKIQKREKQLNNADEQRKNLNKVLEEQNTTNEVLEDKNTSNEVEVLDLEEPKNIINENNKEDDSDVEIL